MSSKASPEDQGSSTRPYLIRALHEWCSDNGFTPYLAVHVTRGVQVPMEYVKNQEIVLNVGFEATSGLKLGNDTIEFKARFGGVARDIVVPVDHVVAIYARENGQGMAFPMPSAEPADEEPALLPPPAEASARPAATGLRLAGGAALEAVPAPDGAAAARVEPMAAHDATPDAALASLSVDAAPSAGDSPLDEPPPFAGNGRPALKRIK